MNIRKMAPLCCYSSVSAKEPDVGVKYYEQLCPQHAAMLPDFHKLLLVFSRPLEGKLLIELVLRGSNKQVFSNNKYEIELSDYPREQQSFLHCQNTEHANDYLEQLYLTLKRIIAALSKT